MIVSERKAKVEQQIQNEFGADFANILEDSILLEGHFTLLELEGIVELLKSEGAK